MEKLVALAGRSRCIFFFSSDRILREMAESPNFKKGVRYSYLHFHHTPKDYICGPESSKEEMFLSCFNAWGPLKAFFFAKIIYFLQIPYEVSV